MEESKELYHIYVEENEADGEQWVVAIKSTMESDYLIKKLLDKLNLYGKHYNETYHYIGLKILDTSTLEFIASVSPIGCYAVFSLTKFNSTAEEVINSINSCESLHESIRYLDIFE